VDGDPWLGVDVRVYDDRVPDESGQRMRGQTFGLQDTRKRVLVSEGAVDLELINASENGRHVFQSVYLHAGVQLLVE
jgi:hypothetical protein